MPYRVDVARASDAVLDRLVELGALDVDRSPGGGIAAYMKSAGSSRESNGSAHRTTSRAPMPNGWTGSISGE